jgi:hypothetical protein
MDITSQSNSNAQYTNDTLVPVSKNFLKKTLIKNEAIKRANKELLDLYNIAINKKPEVIEIEKVKYIKKEPTLSERYEIFEKINAEKEKKNQKNKEHEKKKKERKEQIEIEKFNELQHCEKYQEYKKEHELFSNIFLDSIKKKKKILKHYANAMDADKDNNNDLKIQVYDLIIGKNI